MNLDKTDTGYKFTIQRKEGNYNMPNRNYLLRFRNMLKPAKIIFKKGETIQDNYPYENEKNDLLIKLTDINVFEPIEVDIIGKDIEIETISVINEEIEGILDDLEIRTSLKDQIDTIIFNPSLPINKKRVSLRKLKKQGLEPKYINMFIGLLEFIETK